ncbi:MAG: endonuclease domain-containing protein [Pseudomonadota bacterium]
MTPPQTPKRRGLRKNSTEPERRLWAKIRNKQLGVKFRRQHGIGPYIVDFYCAEYSLVIELDGDSHFTPEAQQYDHKRENFMRTLGLETLRFTNQDMMENSEGVLMMISEKIDTRKISP